MSDEPGNPTPEEREAKLAALEKQIEEQAEALRRDKDDMEGLKSTLGSIAESLKPVPAPAPRPAPEPLPSEEDFEQSSVAASAQIAGRVMKEGLTQYHNVVGSEINDLKEGQKEWELEKLQQEDPETFKLIEKDIREEAKQYNYTSGLMRRIFNLHRGERFDEIRKIKADKAAASAALSEPVAEPNTMGSNRTKTESTKDTLTAHQVNAIRGLRINPKEYFLAKYGRSPEFGDGYLKSLGLSDEEVGSNVPS
jgi:hypothetical protein